MLTLMIDDFDLRSRIGDAIAEADPTLRDRLHDDAAAYLDLVVLTARARTETEALLRLAVAGARAAGCTWEAIGQVLGTTRQAAQQRWGGPDGPDGADATPAGADGVRTMQLRPVTAFNEMRLLDRAGRYGWHVIASGTATHILAKSDVQWEHRRVFASKAHGRALEAAGWQHCTDYWFPWAYYKRPLDRPAEPEPADSSYLTAQ